MTCENMKCPVCGNDVNAHPIKEWKFSIYDVKRYTCPSCGAAFNTYEYNDKEKYTIPKRMQM
ncbi:MAG: hypothetical protein ACP5UV_01075 [Thermoplasmata archaeon]